MIITYSVLLIMVLSALLVIFFETNFDFGSLFCKYFVLSLLVVVFFSPGFLTSIVILGVLAVSLAFDFFISLFGIGVPEPHPLGSLLGVSVVFVGTLLCFLSGVIFELFFIIPDKERILRWS